MTPLWALSKAQPAQFKTKEYDHCENDILESADTLWWDAEATNVPIESIWMEYQESLIIISKNPLQ